MGPYFKDQKPEECGHYYPDVMIAGVRRLKDGFNIVIDCVECGRHSDKVDKFLYMQMVAAREREGWPLMFSRDEVKKHRVSEIQRLGVSA